MKTAIAWPVVVLIISLVLSSPAEAQIGTSPDPLIQSLKTTYPGVTVYGSNGRIRTIFGTPMTRGQTSRQAARAWIDQYGGVFGEPAVDLREAWSVDLTSGKSVHAYQQYMNDVPVEGSLARVVVDGGESPHVISVAAKIAIAPKTGLPSPSVASNTALSTAKTHAQAAGLTNWRNPEVVAIYADAPTGNATATLAWKCVGTDDPNSGSRSFTFFVDAVRGNVVRFHSNTLNMDTTGTIAGYRSPGTLPDLRPSPNEPSCPNPAQLMPMPYALVEAFDSGGTLLASTFADQTGSYTLPVNNPATIKATMTGPFWVVVDAAAGVIPSLSQPGTSPNFVFNSTPSESGTAAVNAFVHVGGTRDYFKSRIPPGFQPGLDESIAAVVQFAFIRCTGVYQPNTTPRQMLFVAEKSTPFCANHAYSTVVSHEYGHYLADIMLGIGVEQDAFHEGFGDTLAHLVHDTELVGENWKGCCTLLRDPLNTRATCQSTVLGNRQYPDCDTARHTRGMLLSGIWLDLLRNMRTTHGSQGLELTRQLHVDWCFITAGERPAHENCPSIPQVADAGTLIEVLTADDDDGNFANGTPSCAEILAAFASHGITVDNLDIGLVCGGDNAIASGRGCAVDLDTATGPGVLDLFDFIAFQRLFIARDTIACDCDMSTGPGVCDVFDFLCFQNAFVAGCP